MNLTARQANAISKAREALQDILERAEHECEVRKRTGEKQGNYREIAAKARQALRALSLT